MKNTITTLAFLFVALVTSVSFAQQSSQEELYESSKKVAFEVSEKLNLDEDETTYLTRAILSFEMSMQKVAMSQQSGSSDAQVNEYKATTKQNLEAYVTDMFQAGKAQKILGILEEKLDKLN